MVTIAHARSRGITTLPCVLRSKWVPRRLAFVLTAILGSTPLLAADDPAIGKDLGATIALQGLPCDKVVDVKRNGDSDYLASCMDGNRYHVFVDSSGRVVVKKQ